MGWLLSVWRDAPEPLQRLVVGFVSAGVVLATLGVIGDVLGWWADASFTTNLASSLTSFCFAVPVAALFLNRLDDQATRWKHRELAAATDATLIPAIGAWRSVAEFLRHLGWDLGIAHSAYAQAGKSPVDEVQESIRVGAIQACRSVDGQYDFRRRVDFANLVAALGELAAEWNNLTIIMSRREQAQIATLASTVSGEAASAISRAQGLIATLSNDLESGSGHEGFGAKEVGTDLPEIRRNLVIARDTLEAACALAVGDQKILHGISRKRGRRRPFRTRRRK